MSKVFLASRVLILLALVILIVACFWGWANRTTAQAVPEQSQLEQYKSKKPGPVTTAFFVGSIFLGLLVVGASVWIEYKRVQELEQEATKQVSGGVVPGDAPDGWHS